MVYERYIRVAGVGFVFIVPMVRIDRVAPECCAVKIEDFGSFAVERGLSPLFNLL